MSWSPWLPWENPLLAFTCHLLSIAQFSSIKMVVSKVSDVLSATWVSRWQDTYWRCLWAVSANFMSLKVHVTWVAKYHRPQNFKVDYEHFWHYQITKECLPSWPSLKAGALDDRMPVLTRPRHITKSGVCNVTFVWTYDKNLSTFTWTKRYVLFKNRFRGHPKSWLPVQQDCLRVGGGEHLSLEHEYPELLSFQAAKLLWWVLRFL